MGHQIKTSQLALKFLPAKKLNKFYKKSPLEPGFQLFSKMTKSIKLVSSI